MADFKIPYGAEFSPEKIEIKELLKLAKKHEGDVANNLIVDIAKQYFNDNETMGNNCRSSMVAYSILESGGEIHLSSFGNELISIKSETEIYDAMAKRILIYLSGMMFIEAIRTIFQYGKRPTLVNVTETLNEMGCKKLSKTNKQVPTMKKWLEKAKILNGWDIQEKKLESIVGIKNEEIDVLKGLSYAQICFVRALCNSDNGSFQSATKIRELAKISFNVSFEEKSFAANIIRPLEEKGIIERKASTGTHGGNAADVRLIGSVKADILAPVLQQIEVIAGKEVIKYIQKPLDVLRTEIDDTDKHVKGLALEAFAIRMMRIVGLDFVATRLKGSETGGAEVDVIFDTTRLNYSKWQVQCKNTSTVSLDQVAKEVGLSYILKTNVIVILTTGRVTNTAKEYAIKVMRKSNLCIIFIEKKDIDVVLASPANIVDVLNRESIKIKEIKAKVKDED